MHMYTKSTLPESSSSPVKNGGWKTILSFQDTAYVSFREGNFCDLPKQGWVNLAHLRLAPLSLVRFYMYITH